MIAARTCRRAASVLLAGIAAAAAAVSPASAAVRPAPMAPFTAWVHPTDTGPIRAHPNLGSPIVARIRLKTEGGAPEVYPILGRYRAADGGRWTRVGIPMRPNGRTGWVRDVILGPPNPTDMLLVVDRTLLRATLYDGGRVIWASQVGVGAVGTPTPPGRFWIREKLARTFGGSYGPRAFGTSDYSVLTDWPGGGVIGIHGTDQPELIPGRVSHGCIRLRNSAVSRLFQLMPVGTPMHVR